MLYEDATALVDEVEVVGAVVVVVELFVAAVVVVVLLAWLKTLVVVVGEETFWGHLSEE